MHNVPYLMRIWPVAGRSEPGHWDNDLITGASYRSAIGAWWTARPDTRSCCTGPGGTPPRRRAHRRFLAAAAGATPVADLGSVQGDGAARRDHRGAGHAGVLLREGQPVAGPSNKRAGPPDIQVTPGIGDELLRELAPLLAEEGIDVSNMDVTDPDTLRQALGRAVERRNMAMFTPVGHARERAALTMRFAAEAIADGEAALAAAVLDQAQPGSPDGGAATVAGCIGLILGLLDQWLPRARHQRPARADPAACRALRGTRRPRHPHSGAQGTRVCLPRRADRPAWRPALPLRQRSHPRRGPPALARHVGTSLIELARKVIR